MSDYSFNEYQKMAQYTAVYPGQGEILGLVYTALGFAGEAGEVADKVKKILRDNDGIVTPEARAGILKEVGDTLWYGALLCKELEADLSEPAHTNIEKLLDRKARGVLQGSGDSR